MCEGRRLSQAEGAVTGLAELPKYQNYRIG